MSIFHIQIYFCYIIIKTLLTYLIIKEWVGGGGHSDELAPLVFQLCSVIISNDNAHAGLGVNFSNHSNIFYNLYLNLSNEFLRLGFSFNRVEDFVSVLKLIVKQRRPHFLNFLLFHLKQIWIFLKTVTFFFKHKFS